MDILHLVDRLEEIFRKSRHIGNTRLVDERRVWPLFDRMRISLQYGKMKTLMPFWLPLIEIHRVERETTQSCSWPPDLECA